MAGEDPFFVQYVRSLPCAAWALGPCYGRVEAHHAGQRGLGQKAHDNTCVPLCTQHHRNWHDHSGPFRTWTKTDRREWIAQTISFTQAGYPPLSHTKAR